jgi:hypothetical protein
MTTLSGSVAPHVEIAPVGSKWGLASPTIFSAFGQRIDKHMVITGLSMEAPKVAVVPAMAVVPLAGLAQPRSALQKSKGTTPTEQSALDAVRQARVDAYLDRARPSLAPPPPSHEGLFPQPGSAGRRTEGWARMGLQTRGNFLYFQ